MDSTNKVLIVEMLRFERKKNTIKYKVDWLNCNKQIDQAILIKKIGQAISSTNTFAYDFFLLKLLY